MSATTPVPTALLREIADRLVAVDNARHSLDREHEQAKLVEVVRELVR